MAELRANGRGIEPLALSLELISRFAANAPPPSPAADVWLSAVRAGGGFQLLAASFQERWSGPLGRFHQLTPPRWGAPSQGEAAEKVQMSVRF